MTDWKLFKGTGTPGDAISNLPPPPPWRKPGDWSKTHGETWCSTPEQIELVNAALYLRRPLLITGPPGSGKTSLAYAVAHELKLGKVLKWPINSRTTLVDGVYRYDAVGRLRDVTRAKEKGKGDQEIDDAIGRYLTLGPLGTALAMSETKRPRMLLIDEIDKADVDFPNDLLDVLETGRFEIPELHREAQEEGNSKGEQEIPEGEQEAKAKIVVRTIDGEEAAVARGLIEAVEFPLVFVTSNGERDLSPAFLRRCVRLDVKLPDRERLEKIIEAHLKDLDAASWEKIAQSLDRYEGLRGEERTIATDQVLNAAFLVTQARGTGIDGEESALREALLRALS